MGKAGTRHSFLWQGRFIHAICGLLVGVVIEEIRWASVRTSSCAVAPQQHHPVRAERKHAAALAAKSYDEHAAHVSKGERHVYDSEAMMKGYLDPHVLDQRRHAYMFSASEPLLSSAPGAYWLTIGDLRFGSDALFLKSRGARVMATDLNDERLRLAHARGYFSADEFSQQNVESIHFDDDTFDYVLCKEAFHHFPRPMIGFYEMLRVSKRGLVIIEPQDVQVSAANKTVAASYHADGFDDRFEIVGNYVYHISVREILKSAWALKLSTVAVRGLNDHFVPNMTWEIFKDRVDYLNSLGFGGERQFNLVAIVVFKQPPSDALRSSLVSHNFTMFTCPHDCTPPTE